MTSEELRAQWPAIFNDNYLPLAVGIHETLNLPPNDDAVARWVRHPRYLRNLIAGGSRYDKAGQPSGAVTTAEQHLARVSLMFRRAEIVHAQVARPSSVYQFPTGLSPAEETEEMARRLPKKPRGE